MEGILTYYIMTAFRWGIEIAKALIVLSMIGIVVLLMDEVIHRIKK